ncbi:hypothetical protein Taro_044741 [Colocasia esculenta]|uniref:Uncharacterized protein n=1 Tax=Colocasia esculenta TaxID=4460 RepID=A0A843X5S5_COLES|nr:hypothetical protein [Colocasia esculenta]
MWRTVAEVRFRQNCVMLVSDYCCIALWVEVHRLVARCSGEGLRYAVVLAGAFWWFFPERCLGGSGGGSPKTGLQVLPRSALCSFRATVVLPLWFEVCRLVGLRSGEVLPGWLLALLVEVALLFVSELLDYVGGTLCVPMVQVVCIVSRALRALADGGLCRSVSRGHDTIASSEEDAITGRENVVLWMSVASTAIGRPVAIGSRSTLPPDSVLADDVLPIGLLEYVAQPSVAILSGHIQPPLIIGTEPAPLPRERSHSFEQPRSLVPTHHVATPSDFITEWATMKKELHDLRRQIDPRKVADISIPSFQYLGVPPQSELPVYRRGPIQPGYNTTVEEALRSAYQALEAQRRSKKKKAQTETGEPDLEDLISAVSLLFNEDSNISSPEAETAGPELEDLISAVNRLFSEDDISQSQAAAPSAPVATIKRQLLGFGEEIENMNPLVLRQVLSTYRTRDPKLKPYQDLVMLLAKQFRKLIYIHTPRSQNILADVLASLASPDSLEGL